MGCRNNGEKEGNAKSERKNRRPAADDADRTDLRRSEADIFLICANLRPQSAQSAAVFMPPRRRVLPRGCPWRAWRRGGRGCLGFSGGFLRRRLCCRRGTVWSFRG